MTGAPVTIESLTDTWPVTVIGSPAVTSGEIEYYQYRVRTRICFDIRVRLDDDANENKYTNRGNFVNFPTKWLQG